MTKKSASSERWLARQRRDPFVKAAHRHAYRSRSAFKLIQLDDKFGLIPKRASVLVDLGSAPGGWLQVMAERATHESCLIGIDAREFESVRGVRQYCLDIEQDSPQLSALSAELEGRVALVASDMAPPSSGIRQADSWRVHALCEGALELAQIWLRVGGSFVCKTMQGGAEHSLVEQARSEFDKVRHYKPAASRKDSRESYLVATGFRGRKRDSAS